jgi:hypothetical protein
LRQKRAINQQLCARGGPGEVAGFINMGMCWLTVCLHVHSLNLHMIICLGDMVQSCFMDLKFSALYRAWPFHTSKLVTDRASFPLAESTFCHFMAIEVGTICTYHLFLWGGSCHPSTSCRKERISLQRISLVEVTSSPLPSKSPLLLNFRNLRK